MAIVASGQLTLIDMNDSKQLVSYIGSSQAKTVIYDPNTNNYVPNYGTSNQVLTPQLFIAGTSADLAGSARATKWFYQVNGGGALVEITANTTDYVLGTGAVKTLTVRSNVLASRNSMTYICEMTFTDQDTGFDVVTKSDIELVKIVNGQKGESGVNAIVGVLSNESHTIPTDSAGNNGNFTGATTTLTIYEGASIATGWAITQARSGVTVTEATTSATATVTAMSADTGYVEFTAKKSGYADVVKRFTLTKNKQGASGSTPTAYWLVLDASAIQKNASNVYSPTSINLAGKSQTGTANPVNYAGRFRIWESTDGTNWGTAKYTSSANEATKNYVPSATNIKAIKVEFFLAGGTSTLLDEQVIPIVSDGAKGADAVVATVWTPEGNTLKNSSGTLKATVDVYSGASKVTPTAFKWYIQDPSATASSGGDADGGAGWRLLNSTYNAGVTGYTTATISIPASAIYGVASFMCIATYSGVKYRDVTTVIDVTDPIVVTIIGLSTFKNGQGSTELTARLYRNGEEIDEQNNQGYTYSWSLYKQDNTKDTKFGTKTGKTVTVLATDVDVRANLVCEVSK